MYDGLNGMFLCLSTHATLSICNILSCCFVLGLHPVMERIKREVLDLLISLCGTSENLIAALNIMEKDGAFQTP